jgi:hypothetical protein
MTHTDGSHELFDLRLLCTMCVKLTRIWLTMYVRPSVRMIVHEYCWSDLDKI